MDVMLVPGGMRFSAHVDRGVEAALRATGHAVRVLCRECLTTIGQGALANVKADFLLTVHGRRFPHRLLREAKFPTVVWLLDEPQEIDLSEGYAKHFGIVLTNDRNTCGIHGPHKTWYLPLAADPEVHRPAPANPEGERSRKDFNAKDAEDAEKKEKERGERGEESVVDVAFVGGILPERAQLLDEAYQLAPELSWRIIGPDRWHQPVSFGAAWDNRSIGHAEYVDAIRSARVVLDIPRDETVSFAGRTNRRGIPATGLGCRPFEVTGCGRFLLTDDSRADIRTLFPQGGIGIYRAGDANDLVAQIRYWLENEEERQEAALAAREHCLRKHTYTVRVRELVEIVQAWLATRLPVQGPRK